MARSARKPSPFGDLDPRLRSGEFVFVDGGVTTSNAGACVTAGADTLVAGTSVFRAPDRAAAIQTLQSLPR